MRLLVAATALAFFSAADAAPAPHTAPRPGSHAAPGERTGLAPRLYDFKGVPLEISMDDFRKLPHPDGTGSIVTCTGEKAGDRYPTEPSDVMIFDDTEKKLGVQKCIWTATSSQFMNGQTAMLSLANTDYGCIPYSFSFVRDPKDGIMRLYEFQCISNAAATADVITALTSKYGAPRIARGHVQNKIGNSFEQTTALWENSLSTLMVQDRYGAIDDMGIVMTDIRLNSIVVEEKRAEAAAKKNPI
jgi:hypothetical protein